MNKELLEKIKVKAKWVSRRYPELDYEDLVQEGRLVAEEIEVKNPQVSYSLLPYQAAAVSYHFNNLIRKTRAKQDIKTVDIEDILDFEDKEATKEFTNVENNIDRIQFLKHLRNKELSELLVNLLEGDSVAEIARKRNISRRTVYRQLKQLQSLREKWDR